MYSSGLEFWYKKGRENPMQEFTFKITNIYSQKSMGGRKNNE